MVRTCISGFLALCLALSISGEGWADAAKSIKSFGAGAAETKPVCKVYSLASMGADADLGAWIARTIPEVIEPGTWSESKGQKCTVTYHPATRVMVVYHRPDVQMQVEMFLKDTTRAATAARPSEPARFAAMPAPATPSSVMPARYIENTRPIDTSKPPMTSGTPKHLFHLILDGVETGDEGFKMKNFTLRYEGEGIIDSTIADLIKTLNQQGVEMEKVMPVLGSNFIPSDFVLPQGAPLAPPPATAPACLPIPVQTGMPAMAIAPAPNSYPAAPAVAPVPRMPMASDSPVPVAPRQVPAPSVKSGALPPS